MALNKDSRMISATENVRGTSIEKEEAETQHNISVAEHGSSTEADLRKLLSEEAERRHQFFEELQSLLTQWKRELREKATGGEEATVPDLLERLEDVDAAVTPLLQECWMLRVEDVEKREKVKRDSGYSPSPTTSADDGKTRRQAVLIPDETEGFPETPGNQSSIDSDYHALGQPSPREATQHTDVSSNPEHNDS